MIAADFSRGIESPMGSAMGAYWVRNRRRYEFCLGWPLSNSNNLLYHAALSFTATPLSTPYMDEYYCLGVALHTKTVDDGVAD